MSLVVEQAAPAPIARSTVQTTTPQAGLTPPQRHDSGRKLADQAKSMAAATRVELPPSLPIISMVASSSKGPNTAVRAMDRDLRSRWSAADQGPQSLTCDLGRPQSVGSAAFVWYRAGRAPARYSVETSADGTVFERAGDGTLAERGTRTNRVAFAPRQARFVRLTFENAQAVSVYEVMVDGGAREQTALGTMPE
jgi:hypothetical protein